MNSSIINTEIDNISSLVKNRLYKLTKVTNNM